MLHYYFIHSLKNQIKKFLHTWAFPALLAIVIVASSAPIALREYKAFLENNELASPSEAIEALGLTQPEEVEFVVGVMILGLLLLQIFLAELSVSRLFLQADSNLLFASDLSPQKVLTFRVMTTMALPFFVFIGLLIAIPFNAGRFTLFGAAAIPVAWAVTMTYSALFKVLIYELSSRYPFVRKSVRWLVIAIIGLIALLYFITYKGSGNELVLLTAVKLFNAPVTRFIPIWGWIKGTLAFALEGDVVRFVILLLINFGMIGFLFWLTQILPAEYYEETLSKTEKRAIFEDDFSRAGFTAVNSFFFDRKRARDVAVLRSGKGPSVYFHKVLHTRFRFAISRFFSRAGLTYLVIGFGAGLFTRFFFEGNASPSMPASIIALMTIISTLITPSCEDVQKAFFLMQPDPLWKKILFSVMGETVNCALDTAIPLAVGSMAAGFPPLIGLAFLPFVLSAYYFATTGGLFVSVSLPQAIGQDLRQTIKLFTLGLGLLFDVILIANGMIRQWEIVSFLFATAVNIVVGTAFLGLTAVWLKPCSGRPARNPEFAVDESSAKKTFSKIGLAAALMFIAMHEAAIALAVLAPRYAVIGQCLAAPLVGVPVFCLIARSVKGSAAEPITGPNEGPIAEPVAGLNAEPVAGLNAGLAAGLDARPNEGPTAGSIAVPNSGTGKRVEKHIRAKHLILLLSAALFAAILGNVFGLLLSNVFSYAHPFIFEMPGEAVEYTMLTALYAVVIAPVTEEFVFRYLIINKTRVYGERTAVLVSALLFGLMHATIPQLFYASLLGIILGYAYVRTGLLRYTIILHMTINWLTTTVLPTIVGVGAGRMGRIYTAEASDMFFDKGIVLIAAYLAGMFVLVMIGMVVFVYGLREHKLSPDSVAVRTVCKSAGIVLVICVTVAYMLLA